jgi:SAM-dependent methyltransferase
MIPKEAMATQKKRQRAKQKTTILPKPNGDVIQDEASVEASAENADRVEEEGPSRYGGTVAFRALCNATKALLIEEAIGRVKSKRISVLDLGVGKGGDLTKWKQQRVFAYVGIDMNSKSLDQARHRHDELLRFGRSTMRNVSWIQWDIRKGPWPLEESASSSFDVICILLVLPHLCDSAESLKCLAKELGRVAKAGAQVIMMFPDPARVQETLSCYDSGGPGCFGHFRLSPAPQGDFGHAYSFTLPSGEPIREFLVPTKTLCELLEAQGFEIGDLVSAQQLVDQSPPAFLTPFMQNLVVTQKDWTSLGFFATLCASKQ